MLLLAIDTSGKQGSIALAKAGEPSATGDEIETLEVMPLTGGTFSAQLIPQIATLLSGNGFDKYAIGGFAVVSGPGSFTGLRIGLAAVKALADVLAKPIAPVSLLEVCAVASGMHGTIMSALDAGRNEVYIGQFEIPGSGHGPSERLLTRSEFFAQAKAQTGGFVVTPDSSLTDAAKSAGLSVSLLPPITADSVARLGWRKIQSGQTVTPEQLEANYIRRTEAEMLEKIRS